MPNLKAKAKQSTKNKDPYWYDEAVFQGADKAELGPRPKQDPKKRAAQFEATHGREPITDSEIDQVYGAGEATRALDEAHEKARKK